MKVLDDLCEVLEMELKDIVKLDDMSPTELDNAYKAVDIIKDIETIKAMKQEYSYDRGYSQRPYSYDNYMPRSYDYSGAYYNDYSEARAGRDGDGDGRYSERGGRGNRGEYSRHDEKEHLISKIEDMKRQLEKLN